jgi:rubrerythrin
VAKKEGYEQISAIFQETADNEKEHAKRFFKLLEGGEVEIQASYPAGIIGDTAQNLEAAADGELLEWGTLYKGAAETARKEGFEKVALQFDEIAKVEMHHEARYRKLLDNVKNGSVFKKDQKVTWHCRNCGFVLEGTEAPKKCPACEHPQAFFQVKAENY